MNSLKKAICSDAEKQSRQSRVKNRLQFVLPPVGIFLACTNLLLSFYFRENASQFIFPDPDEIKWFFLSEPVFNWGGFFVDGSLPTIHRLPTVLFLLWASISLFKYLRRERTRIQQLFANLLLGGLGGLTLDILAYDCREYADINLSPASPTTSETTLEVYRSKRLSPALPFIST